MPNPPDILGKTSGARYISMIDLKMAYYQIPVAKDSQKYLAVKSSLGLLTWTRMPFGVKVGPKVMQRLVDRILRRGHSYVMAHLDDLAIYSMDWESHCWHLWDVLTRLRQAGLTVNTNKCQFAVKRVKYLGHVLEGGLIHPDPDKIAAIKDIKAPTTKTRVKSIIGLISYYSSFVPNLSMIIHPLTELVKTILPNRVKWTEVEERALESVKAILTSRPVLHPPCQIEELHNTVRQF